MIAGFANGIKRVGTYSVCKTECVGTGTRTSCHIVVFDFNHSQSVALYLIEHVCLKKVLGFTYREYNSLRVFGFNANSITPFFYILSVRLARHDHHDLVRNKRYRHMLELDEQVHSDANLKYIINMHFPLV